MKFKKSNTAVETANKKASVNKKSLPEKLSKTAVRVSVIMNTIALSVISASADAPEGVNTTEYSKLVDIVFWIATIAIAAAGGIPSLIKIVQGQADEDPRGRNAGIAGLVITGALIGAAAAIKAALF